MRRVQEERERPGSASSLHRTRRGFIGAAAGVAAAIGLGRRGSSALDATPAATPGPRTVETIHGPVVVPADPQRIVTVGFVSAVTLLELGVIPAGIGTYLPALPATYPDTTAIERIENESAEIQLEKILALQPDLILGSDWLDPEKQAVPYAELAKIAPTALFEWTQAAGNWPVEAAGCAEALGLTAELDALRDSYQAMSAGFKTTYAGALAAATWDIISASEQNWYLYGPSSSHGQVAIDAGIRLGAAAEQAEGYVELSFEQFDLLAETGALMLRSAGDATLTTLSTLATFNALPAVAANQIHQSNYYFPTSYGLSSALLADFEVGLKALQGA